MNADFGIWGKLTRIVIFLLFLAGLLAVALWYLPLIRQNERMRRQIMVLDTRILAAEEEGKRLKETIHALSTDARAVERLARERLGYARPGEVVIRFEAPQTNRTLPH
jgi:cell division protein FtsB